MLRVLVIEDEPSYIEALEVALGAEGFAVEAAEDGRSGLVQFREAAPDVVLLDLMLPGLSGLDVLRKIREEARTPVIILSAKDTEADIVTALELGADDYLTKPYSVRELVARIRASVRRQVDEELNTKARLLASTVEQTVMGVELDFPDLDMGEFQSPAGPGFLQLWDGDGALLYRSPSLAGADLPAGPAVSDAAEFGPLRLPGGLPARGVRLMFVPRIEEDAEGPVATPAPVTLVLARSIEPLKHMMARRAWHRSWRSSSSIRSRPALLVLLLLEISGSSLGMPCSEMIG